MSDMILVSKMAILDEKNWGIWKPKMEDILYLHDLHDPIVGDEKKPSNIKKNGRRWIRRLLR